MSRNNKGNTRNVPNNFTASKSSKLPQNSRRENFRFGVNTNKSNYKNLVIDKDIQEATPEHLRIEIDKIFQEFLANPEQIEYIFPPDFNNLQRKYIHYKAQKMNLSSSSEGKEPNRQLHLKKKPKQFASQSFQVTICDEIYSELNYFVRNHRDTENVPKRVVPLAEKVFATFQYHKPQVPKSAQNADIQSFRKELPIFQERVRILENIYHNDVIILSSETGSGKTTQLPQYILENASMTNKYCKIICTQPRRISTIAAAQRVAFERGETVGDTVGYHIRLESNFSQSTSLLFCTVGVLLRNLMCGTDCLQNSTHIIVDEIHERDKLSDFLLICLRQYLREHAHLKVILMSATIDTTKLQKYFTPSIILSIPGRLFPIEKFFLEQVLSMTKFLTPQMRAAMQKVESKRNNAAKKIEIEILSETEQKNWNSCLESYLNFCENYDYSIHYEEATVDLLQLLISENVSVDQQHSEKGWTALMIACQLGDIEFINKLSAIGANFEIADFMGRTAYDYAVFSTNFRNIIELLDNLKMQQNPLQNTSDIYDPQYLRQLYDMTTPDDFIDYNLIEQLISYITSNSDAGSILVFLPGYDEIMQCNEYIVNSQWFSTDKYRIFFLHSSMNVKDQCDVFNESPKIRKLILSTNIAETSITVEDVVFVIDVGKVKEKIYDSYNKISCLQTQWISQNCAKQREGRAGRVKPGVCFRLYSNQRFNHMSEEKVPEMLRVSLEELCLNAKIIAPISMNIYNFLNLAPDPPTANAVNVAVENLQSLGALDKQENLTRLGEYLAQLTLEPRFGKMLIFGCMFRCLDPILTLCAGMANKDPFQLPPQANLKTLAATRRRELLEGVPSDHAIFIAVFQKWQDEVVLGRSKEFCHEYFISEPAMYSVLNNRRQLLGQLRAVGLIHNSRSVDNFNINSNSWPLVKAVMTASFFPNVAYPAQRGLALATCNEKKIFIHNTSICATKRYDYWCFYDEMIKNRINFMVRGITLCTPLMVALMGGVNVQYPSSHSINIDEWLEFYFGDIFIVKFRQMLDTYIEHSIMSPSYSFDDASIPQMLRKILDYDEKTTGLIKLKNVGIRPKFFSKFVRDNSEFKKFGNQQNSHHQASSKADETDEWVERHKQGRTPKRFIAKQKVMAQNNTNNKVVKELKFDEAAAAAGPSTSFDLTQNLQQLSVNENNFTQWSNNSSSTDDVGTSASNFNNYAIRNNAIYPVESVNYFQNYHYQEHHRHRSQSFESATYYNNSFNATNNSNNANGFAEMDQSYFSSSISNNLFNSIPRAIVKSSHLLPDNSPLFENNSQNSNFCPNNSDIPPVSNQMAQNLLPNNNYNSSESENKENLNLNHQFDNNLQFKELNRAYFIIKAQEKRNIEIAQHAKKWIFAPQTEKNILKCSGAGNTVYLIFYIKDLKMFAGVAKFININVGANFPKPSADIEWKFNSFLNVNKVRHLISPYFNARGSLNLTDGLIVPNDYGDELMRIYGDLEKDQYLVRYNI